MVIGARRIEGYFEKYSKKTFSFVASEGGKKKYDQVKVRSLHFDKPVKVKLLKRHAEKAEPALLIKYDKGKFFLKKEGRKRALASLWVEEIRVRNRSRALDKEFRSLRPVSAEDVAALERRNNLSSKQAEALAEYKKSKRKYDEFVAESSAMVADLEKLEGKKREQMLLKLRQRKGQEQFIKRELRAARKLLLDAFPDFPDESKHNTKKKDSGEESNTQQPVLSLEERMPDISADQVVIIDLAGLKSKQTLTQRQSTAIDDYEKAVEEYEEAAAATTNSGGIDSAVSGLRKAQRSLFKAFPSLTISTE